MKIWKAAILGVFIAVVIIAGVMSYFTYGYGKLVINMMDPPNHWGPASKVYINYSAIMLHRADAGNESGWFTATEDSAWIDLSTVVNVSRAIGEVSLQAGLYNIVRFQIMNATVTVNGQNYTATVESGHLTIPITEGGIRVNAGQTTYLLIDINPIVKGSVDTRFKLVPAARATPA